MYVCVRACVCFQRQGKGREGKGMGKKVGRFETARLAGWLRAGMVLTLPSPSRWQSRKTYMPWDSFY